MERKKMLAVLGSARKDGNVSKMLDCAISAARNSGWIVNEVYLYEKNITWCNGCMTCRKSGICYIKDDIVSIRDMLIGCNVVALAAPTYFANVSAIVKNMFDRLSGAIMDDNNSNIPKPKLSKKQKYLLLTTCNTPFPLNLLGGQSTGTLKAMNEFFHTSGMQKMGTVVFAGTRNKTDIPLTIQKRIQKYWKQK